MYHLRDWWCPLCLATSVHYVVKPHTPSPTRFVFKRHTRPPAIRTCSGELTDLARSICMNTPRIAILRAVLLLSAITIGMAPLTAAAGQTGACSVFATSTNSGSANLATTSTWHVREADTITIQAASTYPQRQLSMRMLLYGIPLRLERPPGSANGARAPTPAN